jgi:hypothetical protein
MKKYLLSFIFISIALITYAQDRIIKKNNSEIQCKVLEIGTTEIKYKTWDNLEGPVHVIKKSDVKKIIYENGKEELITDDEYSVVPKSEFRARKRAVTTQPFGPLLGYISIGYQQAITPSRALVSEIGWIGPHVGSYTGNGSGVYVKGGMRLKRTPEIVSDNMQWAYNLGGIYVQPELAFSTFNKSTYWYNYMSGTPNAQNVTYYSGAFLLTFGRQSIIGDIFTIDIFGSLGYAVSGSSTTINNNGYDIGLPNQYYAYHAGGSNLPIAWKFGITMGILLK